MTKILIIEDEKFLREEIAQWLTLEGYEVLEAADGLTGVEMATHHLPDLVICDITMPRLDGYGVLLELRANAATAATPFIFVTARAAHEDIREGMNLGADDYITKPFSRVELLQALGTRLNRKSLQEQNRQHELEQLQQALDQEHERRMLKAKLVAMFSHDFRNPLAAIISSNDLLRHYSDRMDESRRLTHLNRIDSSAHQLLQMLDDMLTIAQIETGNLDFRPEALNLDQYLRRIIEDFRTIHQETHPLVYESRFTSNAMVDARLVRQITTNLISNAVKYSPQGSEVRIMLGKDEKHIQLKVQDYGSGIPPEDQQRLFVAFERGSNIKGVPGTGLGLAIVKQAVELHDGSIRVESKSGQGTTMTVMLPNRYIS